MNEVRRLTSESFWSQHWDAAGAPDFAGYDARLWTALLDQTFGGPHPGESCLEVGCANSRYLPLLAQRYGLAVAGLDYTANGCQLARERLERAGLTAPIYQRDLFAANADLCGRFDFVVSFGLVEHFDDPAAPLAAMQRLLRPAGQILTITPNVDPHSLAVRVQRRIGPELLAAHKLMSAAELQAFHERCGFRTLACGYAGVGANLTCDRPTAGRRALRLVTFRSLQAYRKLFEWSHRDGPRHRLTALFMRYHGVQGPAGPRPVVTAAPDHAPHRTCREATGQLG